MPARRTQRVLSVALFCLGAFGFAWPAYSVPVTFDFTVRVEYVLPVLGVELGVETGGLPLSAPARQAPHSTSSSLRAGSSTPTRLERRSTATSRR